MGKTRDRGESVRYADLGTTLPKLPPADAATLAAVVLAERVGQICGWAKYASDFDERINRKLLGMIATLPDDLARLNKWLSNPPAYAALCKANGNHTVEFGGKHRNYCDAVEQIGRQLFGEVLRQIDPAGYLRWMVQGHNERSATYPKLNPGNVKRQLPTIAGHVVKTMAGIDFDSLDAELLAELRRSDESPARETHIRHAGGRRAITRPAAKFADTRRHRKQPMTWPDIFVAWADTHPDDKSVGDHEAMRLAWRRHFGDKAKTATD